MPRRYPNHLTGVFDLRHGRSTKRCLLAALVVLAGSARGLAAPSAKPRQADRPKYPLSAASLAGQALRVHVRLKVEGQTKVVAGGRAENRPLHVDATLRYDELPIVFPGASSSAQVARRHYQSARAEIRINQQKVKRSLRDRRRQIVVHTTADRTTLFSPQGPLTREELDLISPVGHSGFLPRLLPDRQVAIAETWNLPPGTLTPFLGLDAVSHSEVECVLGKVANRVAQVSMAGLVQGAVEGVATEMELEGRFDFDLSKRRITQLQLTIRENRSVGHVGPGLEVVASLQMRTETVPVSPQLAAVPFDPDFADPTPDQLALEYQSPTGDFRLRSDRNWYVADARTNLLVLRRIDRGELVAQCNVSPLASKSPGRHITLEHYQKDIRYVLNDRFGEFAQATEWQDAGGSRIFRVVARGAVEELPIEWRYYLVAHEAGRRVAFAFTVEKELAERLADADRRLVETLEIRSKPKGKPPESAQRKPPDRS